MAKDFSKQYAVEDFERIESAMPITIMTLLNLVAADVSPLHLVSGGSLSRLTSAATMRALAQGVAAPNLCALCALLWRIDFRVVRVFRG